MCKPESTYDAAHLYVTTANTQRAALLPSQLPMPTIMTVFEVVAGARVYRVHGAALQRWIQERRDQLNGPKGAIFKQRPNLE